MEQKTEQKMKRNILSKSALFGASLIWGSSFLIVKNSVDVMGPHTLLGIRFTIGCLLLCILFHKKLRKLNKDYFVKGSLIGLFIFLAYSLQTIGITGTTPGKNAFLTAIYCVLVPFLYWAVDRTRPDIYNISAAILTILGIGLVSLNGGFQIQYGDAFTLAGGFFYAAHMIAVAKFGKEKDPVLITILQFGYAAVFSWIVAFVTKEPAVQWDAGVITGVLYLSVFATAIALLFQNIGQNYTKPAPAAVILSLESVFGVLFSVVFYREHITIRLFIGFLLIFLAVLLSETKLSFLPKMIRMREKEATLESGTDPEGDI